MVPWSRCNFSFVYFKAAFDTIWRGALWKMLRSVGVDPKIMSLIMNTNTFISGKQTHIQASIHDSGMGSSTRVLEYLCT